MNIPSEILIGSYKIPTLVLAIVLGLFYWLFIVWYEGRKDGFESTRTLDLGLASILSGYLAFVLYNYVYKHETIYHPNSFVLKANYELMLGLIVFLASLIPLLILAGRWSWSRYRLLDIYAMAYALFVFLFGLGKFIVYSDKVFLVISIMVLAFYFLVLRHRGYNFPSGVMFSLFILFLAVFGLIGVRRDGYRVVYGILFLISGINLFLRSRRSMYKRNLPAEFINVLKSKLLSKDRKLKDSQQLLIKEDPYLQGGGERGNSEDMDGAILEDYQKSINDAEKGIVKRLRTQVKKALAAIRIGSYGVCEVCGKPIDTARLKVYPEATACIDCANKKTESADE